MFIVRVCVITIFTMASLLSVDSNMMSCKPTGHRFRCRSHLLDWSITWVVKPEAQQNPNACHAAAQQSEALRKLNIGAIRQATRFPALQLFHMTNLHKTQKFLAKIGLGKEDYYFWKQIGKALLCTYTIFGLAWLWNETSPLGWWTLKPRPKEEKEMAHLYEKRRFPYPGDKDAVEEFIRSGGSLGTTIGPKGFIDSGKDSDNFQKQLQSKKFEQEAEKLWLRMRNEVIAELQEKGFDVE